MQRLYKEEAVVSIFDSMKRTAESTFKNEASKAVNNAVQSVGKGKNRSESFTFNVLPTNVAELQALPEASLDSAFKTTALTILALCRYEQNPEEAIEMLNFLKGPEQVSTYEKQFIGEKQILPKIKSSEFNSDDWLIDDLD